LSFCFAVSFIFADAIKTFQVQDSTFRHPIPIVIAQLVDTVYFALTQQLFHLFYIFKDSLLLFLWINIASMLILS